MINDNTAKTYTINLTHIATSYPHSIDIDSDTYKKVFLASSTSDAIDIFLINHLGMGWFKNYFFDSKNLIFTKKSSEIWFSDPGDVTIEFLTSKQLINH